MFLSLPIMAVLKIIFDRTESMKQWGVLLGDEQPSHSPMNFPVFRKKGRKIDEQLKKEDGIDPPSEK
jgi:hypothetical protein